MIKSPNSPESWTSAVQSLPDKQKLSELYATVHKVRDVWVKAFEESVELWVNFIYLRLQLKTVEGDSEQFQSRIQNELCKFVKQSEIAVLKGLKNVQKLYMIPDLRARSLSKEKKPIFDKQTTKPMEKNRSSSFTSMRSQKNNLFSTIKTSSQKVQKTMNSTNTLNQFSRLNSAFSKLYKQKPRFQHSISTFGETAGSTFGLEARGNFSVVSKEKTEQLENQLASKEKKHQEQIIERVSNKMEQKLKSLELDLNSKLNTIIEGLSRAKLEENKESRSTSQSKYKRQQKDKIDRAGETQRQKTRRNSLIKRITSNPITEDSSNLENLQLQNANHKPDNMEKVRTAERDLDDFVSLTKKIKLPISQPLIKIFLNSYVGICRDTQNAPNVEKFGFTKWEWHDSEGRDRVELKESIIKLNKLVNMDGLNGKAQKIRAYLDQCLRCCYSIFLKEDHQMKQELEVQISQIIGKL